MKFREWVMREFRSPPHMPMQYFQTKLQTLQAIEQRLSGFPAWVENEAAELFYQFTGDSAYRWLQVPYDISARLPGNDERHLSREAFSRGLSWLLEYVDFENSQDWSKYLSGVLPFGEKETVRSVMMKYGDNFKEIRAFLQKAPQLMQTFQSEADYMKGGSQYDPSDGWPTVQEAIQYVQRAVQGFQDINLLLQELQDLETKTQAWMDKRSWAFKAQHGGTEGLHKRDTKPVEVLYHATVATSDVLKDGLKSRSELSGRGAVGGGVDDLISFTSDPQIAIAIGNALISAVKVAKGELTFQNIMDGAAKQGIDLATTQAYKDLQMQQDKIQTGWKPEDEEDKRFAYQYEDKQHAFQLFRYYLGQAQEKNILYDPFFANVDFRDFESIEEEEIGVVACRVKMDNASFENGMEEFRVKSSDVLRCKKINVQLKSVL